MGRTDSMPEAHGNSQMPVWAERFVHQELGDSVSLDDARTAARAAENRINRLVEYLRGIQR